MSSSKICIFLFLVLMSIVSSKGSTVIENEYTVFVVKKQFLRYEWIIENFSLLPQVNGEEKISSPIFGMKNNDVEWILEFYPGGFNEDAIDYVSLYLHLHSQKAEEINIEVHANLTLLIANHEYTNYEFHCNYNKSIGCGHPKFISRSSLQNLIKGDDKFTITVRVEMPPRITDPQEQRIAIASWKENTVTSEEDDITYARKECLHYDWTINNFTRIPGYIGDYIESPTIQRENKGEEGRLQLYPRGDRLPIGSTSQSVSVHLWLQSQRAERRNTVVHVNLTLLVANHNHANSKLHCTYNEWLKCGTAELIPRPPLYKLNRTFTIRAEIEMPTRIITKSFNVTDPQEQQISSVSSKGCTSKGYAITDVMEEELVDYNWVLENRVINNCSLLPKNKILSPIFGTKNRDVEWKLHLYPGGVNEDSIDYVSLFLVLHYQKAHKINVKVHAEITLLKSNYVHANATFDYTYEKLIRYGEPKFILRSSLLNLTRFDDTFTIRAVVKIPLRISTISYNVTDPREQ